MPTRSAATSENDARNRMEEAKPAPKWPFWTLFVLLALDTLGSGLLRACIFPGITAREVLIRDYKFADSLFDLLLLAVMRIFLAIIGLLVSYCKGEIRPEFYFDMHHENGVKKSREELEEEALEQSVLGWLNRYIRRPAFPCEIVALVTMLLCIVKCLVRLDVELDRYDGAKSLHPAFWITVLFSSVVAILEMCIVDQVCVLVGEWGHADSIDQRVPLLLRQISSTLSLPLLANDSLEPTDAETGPSENRNEESQESDENAPGVSDIAGDANYKANWSDLLMICTPDLPLIMVAFIFLLLAAAAQIYIPKYTGAILDKLAETFDGEDDDGPHKSMKDVPGFMSNVRKLIAASILGGVFSGVRGSIFTIVGGRANVRLRMLLMDALLVQDIGFFDTTKTGDITSRLSSDTTLVGDQVTLNVNVFLRSLVQAVGVLIFMFVVSWQLSILAFISVPAITILSKWYGQFIRNLTKVMQTKLASGNSVAEAALSSMPTVRAFDAAPTEFQEFDKSMQEYLSLNMKAAVAYSGFNTCSTSLPQLVTALVVFYGGLMVRNGDLTSGELVSFLLYLSSLSDAFSSMGYIFSSLTQAVGAADKVFELMKRKPKLRQASTSHTAPPSSTRGGHALNVEARQTTLVRTAGLEPESCRGEIVLDNVVLYYPARPQRRILNGMSLYVPPGKIAALVGQSGGGKSSVISLVQHLYEQSSGKVMIDGIEVHDLSPRWLSQHVSVVSQEPTLFGRSIKRNIMYGLEGTDLEPTDEEIERAAKLANADSFIEKMPRKYETEVGERGVTLSGGQKQRIAIARALVRKPKILLLDEATSALDSESEAMVQQAIDHMLAAAGGNMTVMVVAHRLSTIRNADVIFVVQDGQVVEQGNHAQLMQNPDGPYTSLIRRQMDLQNKLEDGKKE